MRVTSSVRAIVRSYDDAIKDLRAVRNIGMRFSQGPPQLHPIDCQPFVVGSCLRVRAGSVIFDNFCSEELQKVRLNPRPFFSSNQNYPFRRLLCRIFEKHMLMKHRFTYNKVKDVMASPEQIVYGSRYALKRIIEAIRKKDLSPLSPLMLDDSILSEIATKSKLSSLTNRQLSCLDVSDDDFVGMDGIADVWNRPNKSCGLPTDDPSYLLSSLRFGWCEKLKKPILTYSVDMLALLRKNVLVSKVGSDALPKSLGRSTAFRAAPKAYGLPFRRHLRATVEFAHVGTDMTIVNGKFSDEPFLKDFVIFSN